MAVRARRDVTRAQAVAAVEAIRDRRVACDDPKRESLPAVVEEAVEVARYVADHPIRDVLEDDVCAALLLLEYARAHVPALPATLDRLEHRLLSLGHDAGVPLRAMGASLGIARNGVANRLLRHEAAVRGLPVNDMAGRAALRAEKAARQWAVSSGRRLRDATRTLLAAPLPGVDADELDDIAVSLAAADDVTRPDHGDRIGYLAARLRLLLGDTPPPPGLEPLWARICGLLADHERHLPA